MGEVTITVRLKARDMSEAGDLIAKLGDVQVVRVKEHQEPEARFDFDVVYNLYPKKKGKQAGLHKLAQIVKDKLTYRNVLDGAEAMRNFWAGKDLQFCPYFSTWVNRRGWEEAPDVEGAPKWEKF